jgi:acyl dehydratase
VTERLYFEDFAVGQIFRAGPRHVTAEEIKRFAAEFDPQPFHLDEMAAGATVFGGLAASGWHTAAMTMRMLVDGALPIAGGIIGSAIDELRWLRPVRPGDILTVEAEIIEVRDSSRPTQGRIRTRSTTRAADGEAVQSFIANLLVPRRPPA